MHLHARRLVVASLALSLSPAIGCSGFVEGESSASAGLGTEGESTSTSEGGSGTTTASTTSAGTTSAGTGGMTTTAGTASTTTGATTSAGTTVDPTTTMTTGDPSTTEPLTTTDPSTSSTTGPMPSCDNQVQDGDESDVDCGGSCSKCADDQKCKDNSECQSGLCDGTCQWTPASCLDLHAAHPELGDGMYTLYPDGSPLQAKCDMGTGGWTCVYANDFTGDAEGWSTPTLETCGGDQILGRIFNKGETHRDVDLFTVPHGEVRVTGNLYVLDSWDNEKTSLTVDGAAIWSKTCSVGTCGQEKSLCFAGWWDVIVPFSAAAIHTKNQATIGFTTTLNGGKDDESFGVDDLEVCVK